MTTVWMRSKLIKMKRDAAKDRLKRVIDLTPKPTTTPCDGHVVTIVAPAQRTEASSVSKLRRHTDGCVSRRYRGEVQPIIGDATAACWVNAGTRLIRGGRVVG